MGDVKSIRNVALVGHGSSGKTTMADSFLTMTKTVSSNPSVDAGNSICDFDPEEKSHKYSIEAANTYFEFGGKRFNVIDTPGYPDFVGHAISAINAVDTVVIVVNAQSGIEVNTRRVFTEAEKAGVGRMICISKMDADNINFEELISSIQEMWGARCVPLNVPVGCGADFKGVLNTLKVPADTSGALIDPSTINERLIESIIEVDEQVMERYFEGTVPTDEELSRLAVQAVREGTLIPIVCCSAKKQIGLDEVLEAIAMCGLSPADRSVSATKDGATVEIEARDEGPLVARVFRTRIDPFVQKLSFIRVYSGRLKRDDQVTCSTARRGIKIGQLMRAQGEATSPVDYAGAGDIVCVAKMEELHTGSMFGEYALEPVSYPVPMVSLAVSPKSRGDETKLSGALNKVVEEDPTFKLDRDPQTKELVMTGMSELHLTIIQEKLKRRDKLEVETKEPRIAFRETIQAEAEGMYRHKKQSGGRGQFGEVHIRMMPLPRGTKIEEFAVKSRFNAIKEYHYDENANFLWVDSVVGGVIPGNFMPAIGKGFAERIANGVISGYPVQDLCVEVHFGKHHPVDSSEAAFKTAARMAFRQVFEKARPSLLEPIVKLAVTVPEANVGDVYSDMSGRGGRVSGTDPAGGSFITVNCEIPLREVTTYARSLSSMTGGMGSYTMEFSHYDVMPPNVQQEVIAKAKLEDEEDE
ncbi:MAG TPA: elongation factor G [Pirellulaceae bacterium]|nr:elongation factor G [Pirellulaceae bacterium]HMO92005.1 elongation factor G [Pirellulaceae bacterium]HMP68804.1 elongation factor G [Pirellulaceae bacterium]